MASMTNWYSQDLKEKKNWYSSVADAYNQFRPRYPKHLIARVVEVAQLPVEATILEIGCGPGTATVAFAELGFSMLCLEPNQAFFQLAQQNCKQYPSVEIQNTSFEEYSLEARQFDAVLAASSFHWVSSEVKYRKVAEALPENGSLILLWNTKLEPPYEVYQVFEEVYKRHAPSLAQYEGKETQKELLRNFGQSVLDSGQFQDLVSEQFVCEATYSINDYLALLSTYSPYLELEPQSQDALFAGLREKIEKISGSRIELSFLSVFQIYRKI